MPAAVVITRNVTKRGHLNAAQDRFVAKIWARRAIRCFCCCSAQTRASTAVWRTLRATLGGVAAPVLYAGVQGDLVGLDHVSVTVLRSLAGRGEVDLALTVDGKAANVVRVNFK